MKKYNKLLVSVVTFVSLMVFGQNGDFEKAVKSKSKYNGTYFTKISKALTQEKFVDWAKKHPEYKIMGFKTESMFVFGVPKDCIAEVNFLRTDEDALVVLSSGKLYRMSKNGVETTFDSYEKSNLGLIKVKLNGNWGCIDNDGKQIIPISYSDVFIQNNGLVKVSSGSSAGYFNKSGNAVTPMYEDFGNFYNGLAKIRLNGKYGFINDAGEEVIPLQYISAGDFSEGLASVSQNGKWGYINTSGQIAIPMQYDRAEAFKNGTSLVAINGNKGCIDQSGNTKLALNYSNLSGCSHNDIAKVLIEEGTFTGNATYTFSFGTYTGYFKNGKPHGEGQLDYGSGSWYKGSFVDGELHGNGEERVCGQGESFTCLRISGNYVHNKRHGTFNAWKGTWLTGNNEWQVEFDKGNYVSATQTSSAASDFWKTSPSTSYSTDSSSDPSLVTIFQKKHCKIYLDPRSYGVGVIDNSDSKTETYFSSFTPSRGKSKEFHDGHDDNSVSFSENEFPVNVYVRFVSNYNKVVEVRAVFNKPSNMNIYVDWF